MTDQRGRGWVRSTGGIGVRNDVGPDLLRLLIV
jgi:hypothetical protein